MTMDFSKSIVDEHILSILVYEDASEGVFDQGAVFLFTLSKCILGLPQFFNPVFLNLKNVPEKTGWNMAH